MKLKLEDLEFDYPVPLRPENGPQTVKKLRVFGRSALDSSYFDMVLASDGSAVGAISEKKLCEILVSKP